MGLLKVAGVFALTLALFSQVSRLLQKTLPVNTGGFTHPDFQRVADVFRCVQTVIPSETVIDCTGKM